MNSEWKVLSFNLGQYFGLHKFILIICIYSLYSMCVFALLSNKVFYMKSERMCRNHTDSYNLHRCADVLYLVLTLTMRTEDIFTFCVTVGFNLEW